MNKILKLKDPIHKIMDYPFLKIQTTKFVKNIDKIHQDFAGKDDGEITYKNLAASDKGVNILVSSNYDECKVYQLPMLIRYLAGIARPLGVHEGERHGLHQIDERRVR